MMPWNKEVKIKKNNLNNINKDRLMAGKCVSEKYQIFNWANNVF